MDSTNVEEENSDAAAYGLVALCDQPYDGINAQFSEEIVETSAQVIAAEVVDENSVQIFVHHITTDSSGNDATVGDEEIVVEEGVVEDNVHQESVPQEFHPSAIAVLHEEISRIEETSSVSQQVNSTRCDNNGGEDVDKDTASYLLTSLQEVDIENVGNNDEVEGTDDIIVEGLHEEQVGDEQDHTKIIVSYSGNILDENYMQALKSRQALMREAVEWKVYARMLLENGCSEGANFYEPELLTVLKATDDVALKAEILSRITEKDMLQPAVQFWDFEKVYKTYGDGRPLNCPSCAQQLMFVPFGQRFALRMLYDIDRPVLLVTSFLRCSSKGKKQHEILGYDPRLLRMFPNLDLPFMLFHKAGITKKMMEFIMDSIIGGMTVNRLFDVVKTKYEVNHTITSQFFANEIESIRVHVAAQGGQIEISAEAMFPPYVNCHPSKALLGRCFLASFKEKDEYYKFCMQQLLANECIILDDSLCVGARIGLPGVWGSAMKMFPEEFQGMFLIFNEAKHVLSWTFLKDNKFSEVQNALVELRERHHRENKSIKACFTTKCCTWRDDLRKIFGKWFIVKGNLRLFLDRIIKEMPPDHTYYRDCVNELTLVFREANDTEEIRKEYTADPLSIAHNVQEFVKRWRDVIDDRIQPVLTKKAIELLTELEQHIQAGCLSAIPPEVGDENCNDIHNALRKSVSHCRITIPLVSALFSMCLHDINRGKGAPVDFQYKPKTAPPDEGIGTISNVKLEGGVPHQTEGTSTVSIQTDNGDEFQGQVLSPLVVDKQKIIPASNVVQTVQQHCKTTGTNIPPLLLQALMYYKYQEDFDAFAPQAIQNLRLLPYYSSALNLISHPAFPKEEKVWDIKIISQGLVEIEQKIRRLHIDIPSCARLHGNASDVFPIVSRQLMKDKMCDNLSVDVLEYLKYLMSIGVQIIDIKETELVKSLKILVDFLQSDSSEFVKKELVGDATKILRQNSIAEERVKQSDSVVVVKSTSDATAESNGMEIDNDTKTNDALLNDNLLEFSEENSRERKPKTDVNLESTTAASISDDAESMDVDTTAVKKNTPEYDTTTVVDDTNTVVDDTGVVVNEDMTEDSAKPNVDAGENAAEGVEFDATAPANEDFNLLKKLADKLGAIITVITNLEHCWVIPIFPEVFSLYSPHFFIAYRYQRFFPAWLGNRASVSSIRNINLKRQGREPQCRCGRGTPGKDGQGKCVSRENGKYLTRCICFRLDRGCSNLCDCRNCENPFGKRPEKLRPRKPKIPYRQRYAHEAAKIATCKSSSISSTIATQTPNTPEICDVNSGMESWVPLEHCIFEALINEIKSDDNVITPSEVQDTFNSVILELLSIPELGPIAYSKTTEQISLKLQQRERDVSEYLKIYQMQVDLSLG